ncbi:RadC family protein [Facklamia sp. P9177]|uniref:RadC family protein n=1 Tax=Facklamia sp. P9177 TaxID=3421945 RepID=UPI003D184803
MTQQDQPRERLRQYGAKNLSNHELLAILLRTGSKKENVLNLSIRLLSHFEPLNTLKIASLSELQSIKGIGPAKAVEIKAAIEFGSRVQDAQFKKQGVLTSTSQAGQWLIKEMGDLHQEHLVALFLNSKNEIIKKQTIFIGSVNSSVACPREIFKEAVKYPTARLIIAHNHPSGNPDPSQADLLFTKRMIACGEMMGIELLDHLIIGNDHYLSLREASDCFI